MYISRADAGKAFPNTGAARRKTFPNDEVACRGRTRSVERGLGLSSGRMDLHELQTYPTCRVACRGKTRSVERGLGLSSGRMDLHGLQTYPTCRDGGRTPTLFVKQQVSGPT